MPEKSLASPVMEMWAKDPPRHYAPMAPESSSLVRFELNAKILQEVVDELFNRRITQWSNHHRIGAYSRKNPF